MKYLCPAELYDGRKCILFNLKSEHEYLLNGKCNNMRVVESVRRPR